MRLKSILISVVVSVLLTLTSCVEGVIPDIFNPDSGETDDPQIEDPYGAEIDTYSAAITKIYEALSKHDVYNDIDCMDLGASQLTRAFFVCQEQTTDACKCAWANDAFHRAMNTNTWTDTDTDNDAIFGVFFRTMQSIASCNEFLRQTTDKKLKARGVDNDVKAKIQEFRAEARMIRALNYWMAMDIFGDVPLVTADSKKFDLKNRVPAAEVYQFIVDELEMLASDASMLTAARSNYPRMDKGSALGLLARIYLNAETYKGEAEWLKAKQTCERIFGLGYTLCDNYADLFRGDNGENYNAYNEFLMAIPFDNKNQQSYGGTTFLTVGAIAESDEVSMIGVKGGWGGVRVDGTYVKNFFKIADESLGTDTDKATGNLIYTGEFTCADERGKTFFIQGRSNPYITDSYVLYNFQYGWSNFKFNNIPHNQTMNDFEAIDTFSNVDLPVIRLAEIYLIYAEACVCLGEGSTAQPKMNELAVRTGVEAVELPQSWSDEARDMFVAERARELTWESCRRTDLIRYRLYSSDEYLWPFKGANSIYGQSFPESMEVFPYPYDYIDSNPGITMPYPY